MLSFYKEVLGDKKESKTHSCLWGEKEWMEQGVLIKHTYERRKNRMYRKEIGENTENSFEKFCCKANMRLFSQKGS